MKKKILFLIPNLSYGGAERVLVNLVNNMDSEKYDITVQTLFDVGVNKQYLKPHIKYKTVFKKQFRGNSKILALFSPEFLHKRFIKEDYDIEVSYLEGTCARIVSAAKCKKVGWIHIELDGEKLFAIGFKSYEEALASYNKFDKLVYVCNTVKEVFTKDKTILPSGEVLYNTNETEQIKQKAKEPFDDVVFDTGTVNLCSVAKIMGTKGYDRLARVHKKLLNEGLRHHIYIIGVGPEKETIETYLKENGLTETFTFLGFKDNPYKYVAACDLYICSSRREGFSTAVTEALIVGTPAVSTCCSGAVELLGEHNEYGLVVENSEEGIYTGLKQILSDKALLKHYAEKAAQRGEKFSREATVRAVERMFDAL